MEKSIFVSPELKNLWPSTALGILSYKVEVIPSSPELLQEFEATISRLSEEYTLDTITKNPHIDATRRAYKALGKSPHEYRNAAEAMLRRVVKGSGLYHINNVVEINNLISISSGYSIGSYDLSALVPAVELRQAEEGAHYDGIGKSSVNIGHLPVLFDAKGPFGNPTSDSRRAMIQPGKRNVMSVLYAFDGARGLSIWLEEYAKKLAQFCGVTQVDSFIV